MRELLLCWRCACVDCVPRADHQESKLFADHNRFPTQDIFWEFFGLNAEVVLPYAEDAAHSNSLNLSQVLLDGDAPPLSDSQLILRSLDASVVQDEHDGSTTTHESDELDENPSAVSPNANGSVSTVIHTGGRVPAHTQSSTPLNPDACPDSLTVHCGQDWIGSPVYSLGSCLSSIAAEVDADVCGFPDAAALTTECEDMSPIPIMPTPAALITTHTASPEPPDPGPISQACRRLDMPFHQRMLQPVLGMLSRLAASMPFPGALDCSAGFSAAAESESPQKVSAMAPSPQDPQDLSHAVLPLLPLAVAAAACGDATEVEDCNPCEIDAITGGPSPLKCADMETHATEQRVCTPLRNSDASMPLTCNTALTLSCRLTSPKLTLFMLSPEKPAQFSFDSVVSPVQDTNPVLPSPIDDSPTRAVRAPSEPNQPIMLPAAVSAPVLKAACFKGVEATSVVYKLSFTERIRRVFSLPATRQPPRQCTCVA